MLQTGFYTPATLLQLWSISFFGVKVEIASICVINGTFKERIWQKNVFTLNIVSS